MDRRQFIKAGLAALAAGSLAPPAQSADPPQPGLRTGPYLQDPATDGMTVMWMTTVPCFGTVEYGPTKSLGLAAHAEVNGQWQAGNVLHRVRLRGLTPGARYFYKVTCKPVTTFQPYKVTYGAPFESPVHSFATPNPASESLRFLVYNDFHDNVGLWKTLHGLVAREAVDFVFLNGDITDVMQDENQMVGHFLDVCTELFATNVPFLYTRGNHETRGALAQQMCQYLGNPDNRYYYGFSWGCARFVVLDTGEDKPDSTPAYAGLSDFDAYRTVQQEWLKRETASHAFTSARFRIAIHHIPAYYNVSPAADDNYLNHGAMDSRAKWWPIFNQRKVDLYLGGHTHLPTIKKPDPAIGHDFAVVIGGGPRTGIGTVMLVDVNRDRIHLKMYGDNGAVIGEVNTPAT